MYCTRLKNLLEYYCRSRSVENKFERLFSLLVSDRIKAVLPQSCLNFILSAEVADPSLAYRGDKIANMADTYHATHTFDGKPKVAGHESVGRFTTKTEATSGNKGPVNSQSSLANHVSETQPKTLSKASPSGSNFNASANVRCFQCNQLGHTRKNCTNRPQGTSNNTARKVVTSARVQAYVMDNTPGVTSNQGVGKSAVSDAPTCASVDHGTRDVIGSHGERDQGAVNMLTRSVNHAEESQTHNTNTTCSTFYSNQKMFSHSTCKQVSDGSQ